MTTERQKAIERYNAFILSGDGGRGDEVMRRIMKLAATTDGQQEVMHQSVTLHPEDARDFIAGLSRQGMTVVATLPDDVPTDSIAVGICAVEGRG